MKARYPAEWEPQSATWLSWPHNAQNWGKRKQEIESFYAHLIDWITQFQPVALLVPPERHIPESVQLAWKERPFPVIIHSIQTNDIWIRDYGPFFMEGGPAGYQVKFEFNAWGGKFPPWDRDNEVPQKTARLLGHMLHSYAPILEGGAMEFNGCGIGMTTQDCLIGPTRNPVDQLALIQTLIKDVFHLEDLIVLPCGLVGDHTDGHIDNLARFVGPRRIVMCSCDDTSSPNYPILKDAYDRLKRWMDARPERDWILDTLPLPPQRKVGDEILPASYMNFIYVNGGVLVPIYDSPQDQVALDYFRSIYADRTVDGMDCRLVIQEGGSLHCMSKQQPA